MMEYRGIQLDESVKLYMNNGELNKRVTKSLDKIADLLEKNNHILKSKYKKDKIKILIKFNCEHEPHWILPSAYKKGIGCSKCSGNCPEQAKENFLKELKKRGHKLMSLYKTANEKVLIDFSCGHKPHFMRPLSYMHQNHDCPRCKNACPEQAKENFEKRVIENGHIQLSPYIKALEKVLIDFNCGHEPNWTKPSIYMMGVHCPRCMKNSPKQAKEDLINLIKENGHELLSEYITALEKVLIDFNCGHEPHWIKPNDYKTGIGCPHCSESKGVKFIREWLEQNQIEYVTEYCLPNKKWRYDIFIPSKNLIVEVQGVQHYKEIKYFSNRTLKQEQENDRKKREYAEKLEYNYIEVDYKESKPKLALKRFLKAFNEFDRVEEKELQLSLF